MRRKSAGWAIFRGANTGNAAAARDRLKKFADALGQIHFSGPPQLTLAFVGDARDVHSFNARLAVNAPAVQTPWGDARAIQFTTKLTAPGDAPTNSPSLPGFWTNLQPFRLTWTARAAELRSGRINADTVECDGVWRAPELTLTKLSARRAALPPGLTVRDLEAEASLTAPAAITNNADASWSWWTKLQPYQLAWTARFGQLESDKLNADSISLGGFWRAPELALTNLSARIGDGPLEANVRLNVATREFEFTNSSRFDLHAIAALLTDKTRERLAKISWKQPPSLRAGGSLILPAWTNRQPDWRGEVQPTIRLLGELAFTNAVVFGATIDLAEARFAYSNLVWQSARRRGRAIRDAAGNQRQRGRRHPGLPLARGRRL